MKRNFLTAVIPLLVTGLVLLGSSLPAAAVQTGESVVHLKVGDFSGTLTDSEGFPVERTAIKVLDKEGNTVSVTVTDGDGNFVFKEILTGDYTLIVGEDLALSLVVSETAELASLSLIVPSAAAGGLLGASPFVIHIVGGVAVATAIITPVALEISDDDHSARLSP